MLHIEIKKDPDHVQILLIYVDGMLWKKAWGPFFARRLNMLRRSASLEQLEAAFAQMEYQHAWNYALRLLGKRAVMRAEMRKKLQEKCVSPCAIQRVLARCEELKYLDDAREIELLMAREVQKGRGQEAIRKKLMQKTQMTYEEAKHYVSFSSEEQLEQMRRLISKKYPRWEASDFKAKQKIYAFLYRRGFSPHLMRLL